MQKITTLLIIILFLCACGKTDKNLETAQDSASVIITEAESQPLTEAECWKLFDTFWVEFQSAIVNDDTNKLKGMCEFEDFDCNGSNYSLEFFISQYKLIKEHIKKCNIEYFENGSNYNKVIKDKNIFLLTINHPTEHYVSFAGWGYFTLRNNKYKLIGFFAC